MPDKKMEVGRVSHKTYPISAIVGVLLSAGLACSIGRVATPAPGGPTVIITSPSPDQTAPVGKPLAVDSTSTDTDGIERIELWVDDTLYRIDSNPNIDSPYSVSQSWQSDVPGRHVVVVKAFDGQGSEGHSQPVTINLGAETQATPRPTQVAQVTLTSSPTSLVPTREATPTPTPAPTLTSTFTPTPRPRPSPFKPTGIETHDTFKPIWEQPEVKDYLGYPTQPAGDDRRYARQYFERGYLYWWEQPDDGGLIWAVVIPQPVARQGSHWMGPYEDTWDGSDPYSCGAAKSNPDGPIRGFGKLWCDHPEIAEAIGAARGSEHGTGETTSYGVIQPFQGGMMLYSPLDREVWVLFDGGTWQRYSR